MAIGETVLGAVLSVVFDRLASREVINFFRRSKFDESLVNKLKTQMLAAKKLLIDAEEKQMTDDDVKKWLDELKHWFYRAEEVADEIATEALRSSLEIESPSEPQSLATKVRNWTWASITSSSFLETVTLNIREIIDMLESMSLQKDALGLRELSVSNTSQGVPTTCFLEDPKVYGRDVEKERTVQFLLSEEPQTNRVSVVAIVGMGGLGKTTLAKMVYNDSRVQENFDLKAWVCVSDQFDVVRVTRSIIESVTHQQYSGSLDLNVLQIELSGKLRDKRFLLVLDDVWNEKYSNWERLQAPFLAGPAGSKIIVTTRNVEVASTMRSKLVFRVDPLSHDDAWSLFSRYAFEGRHLTSNPCLEHIGRKIVEKCQGLPLAIKTLGSLLHDKEEDKEWEAILLSGLWDLPPNKSNVMPALWLSYYHLPSHLKPCFSYCAIFPKDYKIDCKRLLLLWMAENLILPAENERRMEDVGYEYLHQLKSRSFLEPVGRTHVTMHDLIHDLAQGLSGNFVARHERKSTSKIYERTRHFSYYTDHKYDVITKFQDIHEAKYLRTFLQLDRQDSYSTYSYLTKYVPTALIPRLSWLRILTLSGYANLILPESIGCLKQLRYLDVSGAGIKQLPQWVSTLYNLQTLLLSNCKHLASLPADMWKLGSLRHLYMREATSLSAMPKQMSKLKSLQTLTDFVVGNKTGSSIEELRELQEIRGMFALRQLQNVIVPNDAYAADLSNRNLIVDLELEFNSKGSDDSAKDREVLEILKPPSNVERLTISNYSGTAFPKWLNPTCADYKEIAFLHLRNCRYCITLPPLGQLPSLKNLQIEGMDYIKEVGHQFYGHDIRGPFPSLESLTFKNMKGWEVWSNVDGVGGAICFPRLKELFLTDCPNLRGNLPVHVPSLVKLGIAGCVLLRRLLARVPAAHVPVLQQASCPCPHAELPKAHVVTSITKLSLVGLVGLVKLPTELVMLSSLSDLSIHRCDNLKSLADVQLPSSLKSLHIDECESLESLPVGMESLTRLHNLRLGSCHRLIWVPGSSLPTSLRSLAVQNCDRWEFPISMERMQHYTSLEHLELRDTSKHLVCFPLGIFPNLRYIWFQNCEGLGKVYIPEGIEGDNLVSLSDLRIRSCDALEMIGKETGRGEATTELAAPNLKSLIIGGCEKVKPVVIEREGEVLQPNLGQLEIDESNSGKIRGESPHSLRRSLLKFLCLTFLTIKGFEVECFPVAGEALPTSLTGLWIYDFGKLRKLDGEALHRLQHLKYLGIFHCPELERLPEEGLPPSLGSLWILGCPKVEKRCEPHKGKDCSKIHHIPRVLINNRSIWAA